jgi:hypothetical protein
MTLVDLNVSRERVRRSRQPGGEGDMSVETSLSPSRQSPGPRSPMRSTVPEEPVDSDWIETIPNRRGLIILPKRFASAGAGRSRMGLAQPSPSWTVGRTAGGGESIVIANDTEGPGAARRPAQLEQLTSKNEERAQIQQAHLRHGNGRTKEFVVRSPTKTTRKGVQPKQAAEVPKVQFSHKPRRAEYVPSISISELDKLEAKLLQAKRDTTINWAVSGGKGAEEVERQRVEEKGARDAAMKAAKAEKAFIGMTPADKRR